MRVFGSNNEPHDFCRSCAPTEEQAVERFGNDGPGPDGRGNCFSHDADHPPYRTLGYRCEDCGAELTDED